MEGGMQEPRSVGEMDPAAGNDTVLVEALRRGDEAAFVALVNRHYPSMVRLALIYVNDSATAEDVVGEAWLGVLRGLPGFEGRSSLKTWMCRIVVNIAKTRARRDGRSIPFSALASEELASDEPSVDPSRFRTSDPSLGHWSAPPESWTDPDERLFAHDVRAYLERLLERLPPMQRQVITLRDIEGLSAEEVCNILDLSETNQRVLLHRARSKVRGALEAYLKVQ